MAFPITDNPSRKHFSQTPYKAQLQTRYEAGVVQSRPKHTSSRMVFTTGFDALTETKLQSLYAHFNTNVGITFNWTHSITSTVYVVRYTQNSLPLAKYVGQVDGEDAWSIGPIPLEEA